MKIIKPGGRRCNCNYTGISATPRACYYNYRFSSGNTPAISSHEQYFMHNFHPLAEGAQEHSHHGRKPGTIEIICMEKHGAKIYAVSLLLQFADKFLWKTLSTAHKAVLVWNHDYFDVRAR